MANLLLGVIYLAFISLGLPDSLMGSAWPSMYPAFQVPVSYAGIVTFIITLGTIISALLSDRLTYKLGAGNVTAISVAMTALALLGFSYAPSFWIVCACAIPYGLGAGAIDAALNNYVALHYSNRHMSWLHAMWGIGTVISPYIMAYAIARQHQWQLGYRYISFIQIVIACIIVGSLPLWVKRKPVAHSVSHKQDPTASAQNKPLGLAATVRLPMAKEILFMFLAYCGIEGTAGLWSSTFAMQARGISTEDAATWASYFYLGITGGRLVCGFIAEKLTDSQMIRLGCLVLGVGIVITMLPTAWNPLTMIGLITIGVGCAPIYPSIIHSTPAIFGEQHSQAMIGVEMASAYTGNLLLPPLFGLIARNLSALYLPVYLLAMFIILVGMHELILHKLSEQN
ncbi:sugar MFS transporter [Alloscardovia omnicolens]|uniref:MFS transporter n=1 Tax=Alloscardovia omnicolens TaxID=419015 RepID=UPI003A77EC32